MRALTLLTLVVFTSLACGEASESDESGASQTNGAGSNDTAQDSDHVDEDGDDDDDDAELDIPTENDALTAWLEESTYASWESEADKHTTSAHMGGEPDVRVFMNAMLIDSLQASASAHPVGAAAVKEHFDPESGDLLAWTIMLKTEEESGASGEGWFWAMATADGMVFAGDGQDMDDCSSCHAAGSDFVTTPYPFEF